MSLPGLIQWVFNRRRGAGMVLAEWINAGKPPPDLWDVDIRRTFVHQNDATYLRDRVSETLGLLYEMHWPYRQFDTSRGIYHSPLHAELESRGACFGEVAGWERANWFATDDMEPRYEYSYKRQNWFPRAAEEHRAVRESVGIFDQTSFAKFRVQGADTEQVLQAISTNNVAVEDGKVVYTQWLNEAGGIEADLTITRIDQETFQVITSPATRRRDFLWLQNHIPTGAQCTAEDITHTTSVISVMGPKSRALIQSLSDDDWSNDAFPFATAKNMQIGDIHVMAQRITFVGELGWEIYVPVEQALPLYTALMSREQDFDARLCGYHTLDSCRLEKGYRHWGHDINDLDTLVEAGLGFTAAMDKGVDFIGKQRVIEQRRTGVDRRIMQFALSDPEPMLYHNETIYRDGEPVGYITSGGYGHTLGRSVGLGIVAHSLGENPASLRESTYEIEIAGERFAAEASTRAMYDPDGTAVKS